MSKVTPREAARRTIAAIKALPRLRQEVEERVEFFRRRREQRAKPTAPPLSGANGHPPTTPPARKGGPNPTG